MQCNDISPREDYLKLLGNRAARNNLVLDTVFLSDSFYILEIYSKVGWPVLPQNYMVKNDNTRFERLADTTITSAHSIELLIGKLMQHFPTLSDSTLMYLLSHLIWATEKRNSEIVSISPENDSTYLFTTMDDSVTCYRIRDVWKVKYCEIKPKIID